MLLHLSTSPGPLISVSSLLIFRDDNHSVLLKKGERKGRNESIYDVYIPGAIGESCV